MLQFNSIIYYIMSLRYALVSKILRHLFILIILGVHFQFNYLFYDFSNLVLYFYIFLNFVFEPVVRPVTHWLNQ
jgi:hypothetical protein